MSILDCDQTTAAFHSLTNQPLIRNLLVKSYQILQRGKAACIDGLMAEHLLFSHPVLSKLFFINSLA